LRLYAPSKLLYSATKTRQKQGDLAFFGALVDTFAHMTKNVFSGHFDGLKGTRPPG
jgi:hypothetical protein